MFRNDYEMIYEIHINVQFHAAKWQKLISILSIKNYSKRLLNLLSHILATLFDDRIIKCLFLISILNSFFWKREDIQFFFSLLCHRSFFVSFFRRGRVKFYQISSYFISNESIKLSPSCFNWCLDFIEYSLTIGWTVLS